MSQQFLGGLSNATIAVRTTIFETGDKKLPVDMIGGMRLEIQEKGVNWQDIGTHGRTVRKHYQCEKFRKTLKTKQSNFVLHPYIICEREILQIATQSLCLANQIRPPGAIELETRKWLLLFQSLH